MWILEWPARAVLGAAWPGLPLEHHNLLFEDGVDLFDGSNSLATIPPVVSAITCTIPGPSYSFDFIPGLLIRTDNYSIWLILDDNEEERGTLQLRDKVFTSVFGGSHIQNQGGCSEWDEMDSSWVAWQRRMWAKTEEAAELGSVPHCPDGIIVTKHPRPKTSTLRVGMDNAWVNRFKPENPETGFSMFPPAICFDIAVTLFTELLRYLRDRTKPSIRVGME